MAGRRVLITGVGSQVGSLLAARLERDPDVEYVAGLDTRRPRLSLPDTEFIEADIRVGGGGFYRMHDDKDDITMFGKLRYLELRRPDRIVYEQEFCDKDGKMARHPFVPVWPETMLTTVTLSEDDPGFTRVTVTWEPKGRVTAEELAMFIQMRSDMTGGWTGSFDKLEALLSK